jgi:hypothetical protein
LVCHQTIGALCRYVKAAAKKLDFALCPPTIRQESKKPRALAQSIHHGLVNTLGLPNP